MAKNTRSDIIKKARALSYVLNWKIWEFKKINKVTCRLFGNYNDCGEEGKCNVVCVEACDIIEGEHNFICNLLDGTQFEKDNICEMCEKEVPLLYEACIDKDRYNSRPKSRKANVKPLQNNNSFIKTMRECGIYLKKEKEEKSKRIKIKHRKRNMFSFGEK